MVFLPPWREAWGLSDVTRGAASSPLVPSEQGVCKSPPGPCVTPIPPRSPPPPAGACLPLTWWASDSQGDAQDVRAQQKGGPGAEGRIYWGEIAPQQPSALEADSPVHKSRVPASPISPAHLSEGRTGVRLSGVGGAGTRRCCLGCSGGPEPPPHARVCWGLEPTGQLGPSLPRAASEEDARMSQLPTVQARPGPREEAPRQELRTVDGRPAPRWGRSPLLQTTSLAAPTVGFRVCAISKRGRVLQTRALSVGLKLPQKPVWTLRAGGAFEGFWGHQQVRGSEYGGSNSTQRAGVLLSGAGLQKPSGGGSQEL